MGKMTVCKVCNKEIASSARICPYCGAKRKNKVGLIITIIILVVFIIAIAGGGSSKKAEPELPTIYKIGEAFTVDNCEVTVTDVEKKTLVGGEWFNSTPIEGAVFVAVQYGYKNIGSEPVSFFDVPSVKLLSPNGAVYDSDISASSCYESQLDIDEKVFSDLNPGLSVRGAVVFEVSESELAKNGWYLDVDDEKVEVIF